MRRRRPSVRLMLLLPVVSVALAIAGYIFGMAWWQSWGTLYQPRELHIPRLIDVTVVVWLFWVASSIGSFLNVVAWRMPLGMSVNGRSHCPRCRAKLRARDNFPVFGWLALGGRCRTCRLPISPRYPIVELTVGLAITTVGVAELYRLSLPFQIVHGHTGPLWAPVVDLPVLVTLLYHAVSIAVCFAFGLIRMDGHRIPTRLQWFGLAWAVIPMLAYPTLMVVPWQTVAPANWSPDGLYLDAVIRVLTAIAAATFFARGLAHGLCPTADPKLDPLGKGTTRLVDLIAIIAVAAIVVGWQATPAVILMASLIAVLIRGKLPETCDALGRLAISMPIALTFQLVFWRRLHQYSFWPSDGSSPWLILLTSALVFLIPFWLRDSSLPPTSETSTEAGDDEPAGGEARADETGV